MTKQARIITLVSVWCLLFELYHEYIVHWAIGGNRWSIGLSTAVIKTMMAPLLSVDPKKRYKS